MPRLKNAIPKYRKLCGMRPQEVCKLRPGDLNRMNDVWEYIVPEHKTDHRGRKRAVFIGPAAQAVLAPYLLRDTTDHCFSPQNAVRRQREERFAARTTPLSCRNRAGTIRKRDPKRLPGGGYDSNSYRRAIHRACDKALPSEKKLTGEDLKAWQSAHRWSPNQLRQCQGNGDPF